MHDEDEDNDGRFPDESLVEGPLPPLEAGRTGPPVRLAVAAWLNSRAVRPGRVVRVRRGQGASGPAGRAAGTTRDRQP